MKGRLDVGRRPGPARDPAQAAEVLSDEEIKAFVAEKGLKVVAATVGEDEHSVGMREILDIKHGGLEKWGFACEYLGTSVPVEKVLDAAIEHAAQRAHLDDHHARRDAPQQHGEARRPRRREGRARQGCCSSRRHAGHRRAGPQLGHGRGLRARHQGHQRRKRSS
jgi:hypothetical protein